MPATRPNFIAVFITAYWDLTRVLRTLWVPALATLLLHMIVQFAMSFFIPLFARTYVATMVMAQLIAFAGFLMVAPFLVATHRFILLGETATVSDIATVTPRVTRFAGWLLALMTVWTLPLTFAALTHQTAPLYYIARPQMATGAPRELALFALTIAAYAAVSRMMILLAAAAIDARNLSVGNALADTRGNAFFIVLATFLCGIPLSAAVFLLFGAMQFLPFTAKALAAYLLLNVALFVSLTLGACIASRVYQAMGDRLDRAPAPQA
jgi:hypothetical protein